MQKKQTVMQENQKVIQRSQKESHVRLGNKAKEDFLAFLNENKKDLSTGFGAFHTDNHSNW